MRIITLDVFLVEILAHRSLAVALMYPVLPRTRFGDECILECHFGNKDRLWEEIPSHLIQNLLYNVSCPTKTKEN